jgi:hypothetical protein
MRNEAMPACNIYNSHAGLQTLCHNPRLQTIRPASVSPPILDHLETPNKTITTICHTKFPFVSGDFWQTRHPSEIRIINGAGTALSLHSCSAAVILIRLIS